VEILFDAAGLILAAMLGLAVAGGIITGTERLLGRLRRTPRDG
jgi:hypothetical protein